MYDYNYRRPSLLPQQLRWLKTVMFPWDAWAPASISVGGITRSLEAKVREIKAKQTYWREADFVKLRFRQV